MATEIRTSSGFCCEIDEAAINDMELLEDLEELDRGNPLQVPSALRRLLGEQGKRALCDHLRTESGRVPVDKVSVELAEIFGGLKSKKIILLAQMLNAGRMSWSATLRETYHILNLRALPVPLAATLAWGCGRTRGSGSKWRNSRYPWRHCCWRAWWTVSLLLWQKTENGQKNRNRPAMLTDKLLHIEPKRELKTFASGEEFRRAWSGKGGGA